MVSARIVVAEELENLLPCFVQAYAKVSEYPCCHAFPFTDQTEKDMLCPYVRVTELPCFIHGKFDDFLRAGCIVDRLGLFRSFSDQTLHFLLDLLRA